MVETAAAMTAGGGGGSSGLCSGSTPSAGAALSSALEIMQPVIVTLELINCIPLVFTLAKFPTLKLESMN